MVYVLSVIAYSVEENAISSSNTINWNPSSPLAPGHTFPMLGIRLFVRNTLPV